MRIDRLDLIAFGPFTGQTLDFSAGNQGLHVILGPNEAGKSSALRALRQLLFGIKPQTTDNFVHSYPELRIGATLSHEGETLSLIRRKAKKSLYLGPEDEQELDESALASKFLGGITADAFERMFTLDHLNLSAGGKATLDTAGEFAQILFGASLDLPRLRTYQKSLEAEMDDLFLPRGKREINKLIGDLDTARNLVLAQSIKGADWTEQTNRLADLKREKDDVDRAWSEVDRQRKRLDRIHRALPDLAVRKAFKRDLAGLPDGPVLSDDFSQRRAGCEETLRDATIARAVAEKDLVRLAELLAGLPCRPFILDDAEAIDALRLELGSERKAAKSREDATKAREEALTRARGYLADLGRDDDPESAKVPVIAAHAKAQIRKLSNDRHGLKFDRDTAFAEIASAGRAIDSLEAEIATLPEPRIADELARTLTRIESGGDLTALIESSAREAARLQREIQNLHAKLGELETHPEQLARVPIPSPEVIESFKSRFADLESETNQCLAEVRKSEDKRIDLQGKIERRRCEAVVPSEDELRNARHRREAGWRLIKQVWREGQPQPEGLHLFLSTTQTSDLGEGFEQATRHADTVADRLKSDAARVAEEVRDLADLKLEEARLELAIARREDAVERRNHLGNEWLRAWDVSGIVPRSPQEMAAWVSDHARLVEKVQLLSEKHEQIDSWKGTVAENVRVIHNEIVVLGEPIVGGETLATAKVRGMEILNQIRDEAATRRQQRKALSQAEIERTQAQVRFDDADRALMAWDLAWARAVSPLGLDPAATSEQVTQLIDAIDKFAAARERFVRNGEILREAETTSITFQARLRELAARHAPSLADRDPEAIVAGLARSLKEANEIEQQRGQIGSQHREKLESIHALESRISGVHQALLGLCREADCTTVEQLHEVETRWESRRSVEAQLIAVEDRLRPLALGKSLDDFTDEAAEQDADELPTKLQTLEGEYEQKDEVRQTLSTQIGQEQERLRGLETTARLARAEAAAADCEHLMARLESEVDRYVHLRLAWAVLRDAIEEFRKKNQAPVLQRAGALFAGLTRGSFSDLRVDLNEKDQPVLMGVRPSGQPAVGLDGMSLGTVDQLYLALKLALLDHYLQTHPALPLVLDDLLIQFDDERAGAALSTLAELSRNTQILFFTHHEHLVELATKRLPREILFIHRLAGAQSA